MADIEKKHIVIVDDDLDIQEIVIGYFKPRGYRITTFSDAETGLKELEGGLQCDVIIADLQLPKMSGLDFMTQVKSHDIQAPIIIMTVTSSVEIAMKAIQAGAYDFIVKPIHFAQLQVSVERAIHLNRLKKDNQSLRSLVKDQENQPVPGIIGRSPKFVKALDLARRVAKSAANVFITGESGTGKELVARLIHASSPRRKGPFVAINCSAIPENLLESELFGHAKGAFTGAQDKKLGLFEEAEDGTIFLDEIGDLSLTLQAKLLRVLQERKIKRVGENQSRNVNARVISATHKNLLQEVTGGRFREDLYFRLNVIPINVPSLRERKEDIVPLAEHFLRKYAALNNSPAQSFAKDALQFLFEKPWRGNVRELENTIERSVVLCTGEEITKGDLLLEEQSFHIEESQFPESSESDFPICPEGKLWSLHELTQRYIQYALSKNNGAKDKTAKDLGIDRKTLYRRVQQIEAEH